MCRTAVAPSALLATSTMASSFADLALVADGGRCWATARQEIGVEHRFRAPMRRFRGNRARAQVCRLHLQGAKPNYVSPPEQKDNAPHANRRLRVRACSRGGHCRDRLD